MLQSHETNEDQMKAMLNEILEAAGSEALGPRGIEAGRTDPLAREDVERWSLSNDIDTLGALCSLLDHPKFRERIQPPLSFEKHQALLLKYWERCLLENPRGEWTDSRYEAGWNLARWFSAIWTNKAVPRQRLLEIKHLLANIYKQGHSEVRACIINATLEHLFEDRAIAMYFKDWEQDPVLATAFEQAMLWPKKGGTSPLPGAKGH